MDDVYLVIIIVHVLYIPLSFNQKVVAFEILILGCLLLNLFMTFHFKWTIEVET